MRRKSRIIAICLFLGVSFCTLYLTFFDYFFLLIITYTMRTNCFTILRFPGGVIKRLCLVLVLALSAGLSLNAQTTWYSPGRRLGIDEINAGDVVFIYSMCYVYGSASSDYSRFIVNDGNSAKAGVGKPATLHTQNIGYVWKVRSKETVGTGVQLTFSRNAGSENTTYYWGIGGVTSNTSAGDPQKMVVTQWTKDPYVSGTSKAGDDVYWEAEDGAITHQSSMTETDKVYLVSALTGTSVNTDLGGYQSTKAYGYPVAFYSVVESQEAPADPLGIHISAAPVSDTGRTIWHEGTKWYKLKMDASSWRYVDTNHAYCDASGNFQLNKTASSDALSALWAVEGNETDGYKLYNMATGPGKVLGVTGSEGNARTKMVDPNNAGTATTTFDITYHYAGWYIKKHGTTNNYLNNRDYNLALWNTSDALGNSGSAFKFEAVDNVTTYVTAAQTKIVGRAEDWINMPAVWAEATATYNALNGVTLSNPVTNAEIVAAAEAQAAAGAAFVSAVNNQKVTLSNCATNERRGAAMYVDTSSSTVKGRTPAAITVEEVMVLKANPDFTIKLYNALADKYIGTPGGSTTSAVALASAGNFDIYSQASAGQNKAIFCVNGTASMHLLNDLNISNYSSTTDVASYWQFSTEVSRHELKAEIAKAPTWLNDANLINPSGIACVADYKAAMEAAETVNNNELATVDQVNTALEALKAKWDNLASRLFAEASPAQGYRLKFNSDANLYMTFTPGVAETHAVNVMNVQTASNAAKQTVKIQPAAEEGKFTIQEGATSKYVGISSTYYWNPSLVDAAGATFTFEPVALDHSLAFKIKTIHGVLAPGADAPAANAYVYTNQNSEVARYWIVEPYVSPDSVNALKATIAKTEIYLGSKVGQYVSRINVAPLNSVSQSMVDYTDDYADMQLTNTLYYNQIAQYDNVFTPGNLTINQPTAGRVYRFKGKVSGKYMCAATATPSDDTMMTMVTDSTQLGTLFILQEGEEIDGLQGFKFLSYNTGYYTKNTHNNGALSAAANSVKVYASETAANLGYYTLKSNRNGDTAANSTGTYLYDNGRLASPVVDRNTDYAANNCDWTIEEVTKLPISVTTGYSRLGTIVSPVSLNADNSKLKFYTGSINGDYLHLTEFTGDVIPAGVPFLIEYQGGDQTNGCSLLEVNGAEATLDGGVENALRGGLETVATPTDIGTIYTIQKTGSAPETDTQVFRRYTGDTVKGCRAYLPLPADSNIKGMVFDDGTTTEIETLVEPAAPAAPAACYDLSGRRVAKAAKGLYIRDGKKIYVK